MGNNNPKSSSNFENKSSSPSSEEKRSSVNFGKSSNIYPFLSKLGKVLEERSFEEEKLKGISEHTFQKYLCKPSKTAGLNLYNYFLRKENVKKEASKNGEAFGTSNGTEVKMEKKVLTVKEFIKQSSYLLDRLNDSQQLEYYIDVFSTEKGEMTKTEIDNLIVSAFEIAHFTQPFLLSEDLLSAVSKAIMHGKEKTTSKYIFNWVCQHTPRLVSGMHRYLCQILTVSYSTIPAGVELQDGCAAMPVLERTPKSSCATHHPGVLWLLSCSLPQPYLQCLTPSTPSSPSLSEECMSTRKFSKYMGKLKADNSFSNWIPLFNSDEHGLSVNRFQHHVFDYRGPTLLFIESDDDTLFCVASDVEWRDSKHFFGGYDCICLQILPEYKIIERGANMLYFNITSRGFPIGLQVGTDHRNRTLAFDLNMEIFNYKQIPYKLKSLEAWGCGSSVIQKTQSEYKKQANKDAENRQKVKLDGQDWKDSPDRYLLELAGTRPNYVCYENDSPKPQ